MWEKLEKMDIFVSLVQNGCLLARQVEKDEIRLKNWTLDMTISILGWIFEMFCVFW